jgi:polar amino acid transport system substrate-binding protein
VDVGLTRDQAGLEDQVLDFSYGLGCDAVIITAAGDSLDPINLAGALARQRGTIVVLGDVPTGFDREPHFYRKELQVRMSCSYGPGRYDPDYEEKGIDYPPGYVRWTENRNMQAFQDLIQAGRVDPSFLTTHVFRLGDAPKAYDLILSRTETTAGVLIAYDVEKPRARRPVVTAEGASQTGPAQLGIGFIGAGSYAQSHLLPNVPREKGSALKGVVTASGAGARTAADRFGFEFCSTDAQDLLSREDVNTIFIATRHDSHAAYVLAALEAAKHVFVEKPLCLTEEELAAIEAACRRLAENQGRPPLLMVGYNRRFAPLAAELRKLFAQGPLAMIYRINAGPIAPDSWIQDPEIGGGRIVGEVCHFVDLLNWLGGGPPESVSAASLDDPRHLADTAQISLAYPNGSIGTIAYLANGDRRLPKERLEVHGHGLSAVLDDFRRLTIYRGGKQSVIKRAAQDKGQKHMVRRFLEAARSSGAPPIELEEIFSASRVTFRALESIRRRQQVML